MRSTRHSLAAACRRWSRSTASRRCGAGFRGPGMSAYCGIRIGGFVVGDNEPYSGALEGDTLNVHGTRRGLAHALIEIRQDLIAHQTGVDEWIERLVRVLEPILN